MSNGTPESLLFLSCDIVGSTEFKQKNPTTWGAIFLGFYRQLPQQIGDAAALAGIEFELWKAIGDELIFTTVVRSEHDVFLAIRTWLKAVDNFERKPVQGYQFVTKGGAFIATFPGPDSRSSIPRDPTKETSDKDVLELNASALRRAKHKHYQFDFFGPSIDTGFRVLSVCTARFFTLSIEVVRALQLHWHFSQRAKPPEEPWLGDLVYRGEQSFKGVFGARSYPLFALDREHDDPLNQALQGMNSELDLEAVAKVCEACHGSDDWPSRLFLPDSQVSALHEVPTDALAASAPSDNTMEGSESEPSSDGQDELPVDVPMGESVQ